MIKHYCDWCGEEQEKEEVMRTMEFLISTDRVCLGCCKKIAKVRKQIKYDVLRGKDE